MDTKPNLACKEGCCLTKWVDKDGFEPGYNCEICKQNKSKGLYTCKEEHNYTVCAACFFDKKCSKGCELKPFEFDSFLGFTCDTCFKDFTDQHPYCCEKDNFTVCIKCHLGKKCRQGCELKQFEGDWNPLFACNTCFKTVRTQKPFSCPTHLHTQCLGCYYKNSCPQGCLLTFQGGESENDWTCALCAKKFMKHEATFWCGPDKKEHNYFVCGSCLGSV